MPSKAKTAAAVTAEAEQRISEARARLAATNMRRRELQIEIGHLEDDVSAELYRSGRHGEEPQGVAEKRMEITQARQEFDDLERVGEGQERAVRDAVGARDHAMFENAPTLERALVADAEQLSARRSEAEATMATVMADEEALKGRWRHLAAVVPGAAECEFDEGEPVLPRWLPASRTTAAQFDYTGEPNWPGWFRTLLGPRKETMSNV